MDAETTSIVRTLLADSVVGGRIHDFGRALRRSALRSSTMSSGLLLVGTPTAEPWHLAAHLSDDARFADAPELMPTLIRWQPPVDAPAHLAMSWERLEHLRRGETLLVVAPDTAPEGLLQRVADARKVGATVLAVDSDGDELNALAHESLVVPVDLGAFGVGDLIGSDVPTIDIVQHLVSASAVESRDPGGRRRLRDKVARALDVMTGAQPGAH